MRSIGSFSDIIYSSSCFVSFNQLVGINIASFGSFSGTFHLNSSTISHNSEISGSALFINIDPFANEQLHILVHNVTFDRNTISEATYETPIIAIVSGKSVVISNCTISNNEGSGLAMTDTYILWDQHFS